MKHLFPLEPDLIFLNHGSFCTCPKEVMAALQAWQLEMEKNPVEFLGRRSGELLASARSVFAAEIGADPEHMVFTPNATTGANTIARSLPLRDGDEILTTDHEASPWPTTVPQS